MNIERIMEYKNTVSDTIHTNVIYCFTSETLKTQLRPYLVQGDVSSSVYTHIIISDSSITHINSPIYLYMEYRKMSRDMTQTPLKIKGRLKCTRSVSDFTKQLFTFFKCKNVKFIPSGREDIDVRMVGYRPCILCVVEPTHNIHFNTLTLCLYKSIDLINCCLCTKDIKTVILSGESEKHKTYSCLISADKEVQFTNKKVVIDQKTPLRVVHRRANIHRNKEVQVIQHKQVGYVNGVWYYDIHIYASAGTYIKEYVSGDMGRTTPSLYPSACCNLLELDVLEVEKKDIPSDMIIRKIDLYKEYIE